MSRILVMWPHMLHSILPKPALATTFIPSFYPSKFVIIVWLFKLFFDFDLHSNLLHINQLLYLIMSSRFIFFIFSVNNHFITISFLNRSVAFFLYFFSSATIDSTSSSLYLSVMTSTIVLSEALIFVKLWCHLCLISFRVSTSASASTKIKKDQPRSTKINKDQQASTKIT